MQDVELGRWPVAEVDQDMLSRMSFGRVDKQRGLPVSEETTSGNPCVHKGRSMLAAMSC